MTFLAKLTTSALVFVVGFFIHSIQTAHPLNEDPQWIRLPRALSIVVFSAGFVVETFALIWLGKFI